MYLVKSPLLFKWYLPNLIWHKPRTQKTVYLTFDDGPVPNVTDFVLNTLHQYNIKATFFCIGDNICKHPKVFERIKEQGHRIGNHTYNHLNGWATPDGIYVENFWQCQRLTQSNLFRPPYGRIKKSQVKKLQAESLKQGLGHLEIVMWDCLSGDFDSRISPEKCCQNVMNNVRNGSIIVFHDSLKAWERLYYTLPKILKHLNEQGYSFGLL